MMKVLVFLALSAIFTITAVQAASMEFEVLDRKALLANNELVETALGMHMVGMHEPEGRLGRVECRLRAVDRVLRQHPTEYATVRQAMTAFEDGLSNEHQHVQSYFGCVVGMDMMLADCNTMPRGEMLTDDTVAATDDAIKDFLKANGKHLLKQVVDAIQDDDNSGFTGFLKKVEKVVCEGPVYSDVKTEGVYSDHQGPEQVNAETPSQAQAVQVNDQATSQDADSVVPESMSQPQHSAQIKKVDTEDEEESTHITQVNDGMEDEDSAQSTQVNKDSTQVQTGERQSYQGLTPAQEAAWRQMEQSS